MTIVGLVGVLIGMGLFHSHHPSLGFLSVVLGFFMIGWAMGPWPWRK